MPGWKMRSQVTVNPRALLVSGAVAAAFALALQLQNGQMNPVGATIAVGAIIGIEILTWCGPTMFIRRVR